MGSELERAPLEGEIVNPIRLGQSWSQWPIRLVDDPPKAEARICIGGPADGKVIRSASSRLDYRKPSITVMHDLFTGETSVGADVESKFTYVPKVADVLGLRQYRIWVGNDWWYEVQTGHYSTEDFEAETLLRLIDAKPEDCQACRQLP